MIEDIFRQVKQNDSKEILLSLAVIVAGILIARLLYIISERISQHLLKQPKGRFMGMVLDLADEPIAIAIVIACVYWAELRLAFSKQIDQISARVLDFIIILDITWLMAKLIDSLVNTYLMPKVLANPKTNEKLVPFVSKGGKIIVWSIGIVAAINSTGYDVNAIVTGLGIGGVAFAFAAQETLSNLFGGLSIVVDTPFVIGDRIKVNGYDGWVREVTMRTAKLETLEGRRLTIPNSVFSKTVIENVSSEPATMVPETIGLSRLNNAGQVQKALDILADIIKTDDGLDAVRSSAALVNFRDSAYEIKFIIWLRKGAAYFDTISRVNMKVLSRLEEAGIDLSIPALLTLQGEDTDRGLPAAPELASPAGNRAKSPSRGLKGSSVPSKRRR